jgi:hypothetical protein
MIPDRDGERDRARHRIGIGARQRLSGPDASPREPRLLITGGLSPCAFEQVTGGAKPGRCDDVKVR